MKILAVDIGNTSTLAAIVADGRIGKTYRCTTNDLSDNAIKKLAKKVSVKNIEAAVIASVVPSRGSFFKESLTKTFGVKTYLIGKDFLAPIKNRYVNPKQVGIDRLMNAIAAFERYHREVIVIDFGTAITFDVVSKKGEYLGGVIAPGIEISLEALYERTALLPKIKLAHPKNIIGKDTVESIRVGCAVGIGGLCDRVITSIKSRYHMRPIIIATGGYAAFMRKYCNSIDLIDPNLTIKGIYLSYKNILTKKSHQI